jgi:hypothetical protein
VTATRIGHSTRRGYNSCPGYADEQTEVQVCPTTCSVLLEAETMSMKTDAQLKQDIIAELTWEPSVGLSKRTDGDIARSAQSILEWTSWLPKDQGRERLDYPVR